MITKDNPLIKDATLLDDFAGKAMQGILSNEKEMYMLPTTKEKNQNECLAETSYKIAQSMIKERTKHIKIN